MTKKYVKLSPITRLEGHLGVTARTKNGTGQWPGALGFNLGITDFVHTAYSHGEMFRGLEKILVGGSLNEGHGRDPRDAPVITSRTCGVCHFIHRHVSLRNIENAAGWAFAHAQAADAYAGMRPAAGEVPGATGGTVDRWLDANRTLTPAGTASPAGSPLPVGALLARNIVHLVTFVYSHAAHTIALAAPDYKAVINLYVETIYPDPASGGPGPGYVDIPGETGAGAPPYPGSGTFFDNFLTEAVVAQRILHEILGFLGGKVPHQQSAVPGGFSRSFTGPLGFGNTDMDAIAVLATKSIGLAGADPSTASVTWPLLDLSGGLDAGNSLLAGNDWICNRVVPFTFGLAVAAAEVAAPLFGVGSNNFVCAPTFDMVRLSGAIGDSYFRGGVMIDSTGTQTRYVLDPTQEDANTGEMTIWEDITSGKYPYQDQFTGKPKCGGYQEDWLSPLVRPGYPGEMETHPLVGDYECPDDRYIYTWYKATRVKDDSDKLYTVESGPLARLVINGLDPNLNLNGFALPGTGGTLVFTTRGVRTDVYEWAATGGTGVTDTGLEWMSSTWNRLIARLQDALLLIDMLIGSNYSGENIGGGYLNDIAVNGCWLTELDSAWVSNGGPVADGSAIPGSLLVDDTPPNGAWENLGTPGSPMKGCMVWDAPRGITCHFCQVTDGRLSQYQHIAGTSWNGNGRDSQGNPGPFEWSLMNYTPTGPGAAIAMTAGGGGVYTVTLANLPVVERSVRITYEIYEGDSWVKYAAFDVPKHDTTVEGEIKGKGLESSSKIDYETGDIELQFTYNYDFPDYSHVKNVEVDYYGAAGSFAVPTPVTGQTLTGVVLGAPYNAWDSAQMGYGNNNDIAAGYPNPLNILRTIRSYDPCLACSIHVLDKKGRKTGKFEVVPVGGWDL